MAQLNPKKLLNSKWTAVKPKGKEKHFLITKIQLEKDGSVNHCQMQAVMTKRTFLIDWKQLNKVNRWLAGWQ